MQPVYPIVTEWFSIISVINIIFEKKNTIKNSKIFSIHRTGVGTSFLFKNIPNDENFC